MRSVLDVDVLPVDFSSASHKMVKSYYHLPYCHIPHCHTLYHHASYYHTSYYHTPCQ